MQFHVSEESTAFFFWVDGVKGRGGEGRGWRPPLSAESKGQQIGLTVNILNEELDFQHCKNLKFLGHL